jgi:hypothetical protein
MTGRMLVLVAVGVLEATCRHDSPFPSPTAVPLAIVSLTINGPSVIAPGESRQFSAIATFSDKSSKDVSAAATWSVYGVSSPSSFSVTTGLLAASTAGEGSLAVNYQGRNAVLAIVALPSGTGILAGHVTESTFPIDGARIEVMGGASSGKFAVSNGGGFYRLYGVVGNLQIRASREGYVAQTMPITVLPFSTPRQDQTLNFVLSSTNPVPALAGNYRLSLQASASCGAKFPAEAAAREYDASVTQNGVALVVVLSGAQFAVDHAGAASNRFTGRIRPDGIEFTVGSADYYYYFSPGFVERLIRPSIGAWGFAQTTYFWTGGTARGSATSSTLSTLLNGIVEIDQAPDSGAFFSSQRRSLNSCSAADHQLTLVRK